MVILVVVLVVVCVVGSVIAYVYYSGRIPAVDHSSPPYVSFSQNATEEYWKLTVVNVWSETNQYDYTNFAYYMSNSSGIFFHGNLSDIRNKPCLEYNITWLDKDDDYKVSVGDEFIISKTGGNIGKVIQEDTFRLVAKSVGGDIGHVVLH